MTGKGVSEIDRMAVKISHLDRLLGLTGEIIITASNMAILQRHLQARGQVLDKESLEMFKSASLIANRISSDLHHLVMDIRLVPIKETFLRFRRLVRDLAKKKGRQVNFEIVGEDTLVDKTVTEKLYEPLAHQIRNAIDHGLEDPLERKHRGKDPVGRLTLTAYKKEGYTYVSVADDGCGLDENRIRQAAVEKGILTSTAATALSRQDCFALIMQPGFSTAGEATEISGRGVGMDVVKNTVEELGGEVLIETTAGQGSIFIYKIPQLSAVNITDALVIRAGEDYFAVPIGNVVATQACQPEDIHSTMEAAECIVYLGSIIPIHDLRSLLTGRKLEDKQEIVPVIVIEAKNGRIALKVSEFVRPQKLVLIPLPEIFDVRGVTGTTILGGNQIGLVLDPFELISLAMGKSGEATEDLFLSRETVEVAQDDAPAATAMEAGSPAAEKVEAGPTRPVELDGALAEEFFLEIQNILTELNEDIFQLEKEPENVRRINTIFRHFHSIKGNLIMTGFNSLGAFVHEVESVLDRIRDKEIEVSQEIIDLLLDAAKTLEKALASIRAGRSFEVQDQELLAALEKYRRQEAQVEQAPDDTLEGTFQMSALGQLLWQAKLAQGARIFQSMIKLKSRFQEPFLVAYLILRRLALLGDVLDTLPSLDKIEKGLVGDSIKVLFATTRGLEEVNRFMQRQLTRLYDVVEFENLQME
ncbi:MAG: chemotaxis protein CheW [Thermodesulfobacteriota bacterium]